MVLRATNGDENRVRRLQSHERSDWRLFLTATIVQAILHRPLSPDGRTLAPLPLPPREIRELSGLAAVR
jgi:hypothetical protein